MNPKILVSLDDENQLGSFKVTKDNIFYTVTKNGVSASLYKYNKDKETGKIDLPFSAGEITLDYRSPYKEDLWITLSGWVSNPKKYFLRKDDKLEFVELGKQANYPEFNDIISEVVEVTADDGVKPKLCIKKSIPSLNYCKI